MISKAEVPAIAVPAMKLIAAILGLLPLILPLATPRPAGTVVEVVVEEPEAVETFDGPWDELPVLPLSPVGGIQL